MKKNMSIVKKFSFISFMVFATLAIIMSLFVSIILKNQIINFLGKTTAEYAQGLLHSQVQIDTVSHKHNAEISKLVNQGILGENVKGITMWDVYGNILFIEHSSPAFEKPLLTEEGKLALQGRITARPVKSVDDLWLLEVYTPAKNITGDIIGMHHLYWDMTDIYKTATTIYASVGIIFFIGFIALYVTLYNFFKTANYTIEKQNTTLSELEYRLGAAMTAQESTYKGTIQALLTALDAKDNYTAGHSIRVANWSLRIGKELELSSNQLKLLEEAALFHDIGKIGIPEQILNKSGKLNSEQWNEMKKHSEIGAQIIGVSGALTECAQIIRHHHERFDGLGYPDSLVGQDIPLESRILAIADTFDAITSNRPYKQAKTTEEAIEIMLNASGTQLDPNIVLVFVKILTKTKAA